MVRNPRLAILLLVGATLGSAAAGQKVDALRFGPAESPIPNASENTNLDVAHDLPATVTGSLDADDSTYNRQAGDCGGLSAIGTNVFYDTITLTNTSGALASVGITTSDVGNPAQCSSGDTFVAVYSPTFNAVNPTSNCVTSNDDGGPGVCSAVSFDLGVGQTAIVVTSSYGNGALFPYQVNVSDQNCGDGIIYDDSTLEGGLHGSPGSSQFEISQRFDLPLIGSGGASLERICVCLSHTVSAINDFPVSFVIRRPNSSGTQPGARLHTESVTVTDVPEAPTCRYYSVSLAGVDFDDEPVFVGIEFDQSMFPQLLVGEDTNGPTSQPSFFTTNQGGSWSAAGNLDPGYRNLAARAKFDEPFMSLSTESRLLLPGFALDLANANGPTTLFAVRNTTNDNFELNIEYHGDEVTATQLRVDAVALTAQQTVTRNMRDDTSSLDPDGDDFASGVVLFSRADTDDTTGLVGDFMNADTVNAFASGDRLFRLPDDLCNLMEIRFLSFGSGSRLNVTVNRPRGDIAPTYTYTAYNESGSELASGDRFTNRHFEVIEAVELAGPGNNFGSVVFDFSKAGGGVVVGRYSAFGLFSVEMKGACRD